MSGEWSNGLCNCFRDCGLCIVTYLLPFYTAGKNAEAVGEGCCLYALLYMIPLVQFFSGAKIRGMIRESRGIIGSRTNDMLLHLFCPFCALIQEAQELKCAPSGALIARN
ncbi:uncharacterized protein LOC102804618 [Saccoglossus kowalevskii]|uniref:Protein PLANT CADMIUM RESISTANCE 3-like n=1 Tax=Saccoglossus kowalevskii TaxID=10224 RepID=A0ABM0M1C0_SACKO|nr:PREDICTED: protein PLANT CADMIUM RESISTANCE 3-like [Saccoglossus kowalevskii]